MKRIILFATLALSSGALFANVYNSVVDATSWGADLPNSIETARAYFRTSNPGHFYRVVSPMVQLFALVSLLMFWKRSRAVRLLLGAALVIFVATDALTFAFFYPRNDVLFQTASLTDVALLKQTWQEWSAMNWVRSLLVASGVMFTGAALHRTYAPVVLVGAGQAAQRTSSFSKKRERVAAEQHFTTA